VVLETWFPYRYLEILKVNVSWFLKVHTYENSYMNWDPYPTGYNPLHSLEN
jgi:hypothetical protein